MLDTNQLAIWREHRPVLHDINLHVEHPGLLFLVGPGGSGKSSLLHALRGVQRPEHISVRGRITLGVNKRTGHTCNVVHVPQHFVLDEQASLESQLSDLLGCPPEYVWAWVARHRLDISPSALRRPAYGVSRSTRRVLGVLALLEKEGDLYLLDEPTAGIDDGELDIVRARIAALALRASLVVATHNRRDCLALGGNTSLLAGGRIWETAPSERFFNQPTTTLAQTYVATGNCIVGTLQQEVYKPVEGMWWLDGIPLCGMSRPGLMDNLEAQFRELSGKGVTQLFCLEEKCSYPTQRLRELGIAHYHFPIADMAAPDFSQAVDICRLSAAEIDADRGVAMHCRGGLGRTGTLLAALQVWRGHAPDSAIQQVRDIRPHAIQTDAQLGFVHDFADRIRDWH
jgi:atypical dual specificity phosphatase